MLGSVNINVRTDVLARSPAHRDWIQQNSCVLSARGGPWSNYQCQSGSQEELNQVVASQPAPPPPPVLRNEPAGVHVGGDLSAHLSPMHMALGTGIGGGLGYFGARFLGYRGKTGAMLLGGAYLAFALWINKKNTGAFFPGQQVQATDPVTPVQNGMGYNWSC